VVGAKEAEAGKVSVRRRHAGDQGVLTIEELIEKASAEIVSRAKPPMAG